MKGINFFCEDVEFIMNDETEVKQWIASIAMQEGGYIDNINYIFCSDDYLHKINLEYLAHDTLTDIITFDNSEEEGSLSADIFVSIDRVSENAKLYSKSEKNELHRVLIHGVLHLLGYMDKTKEEIEEMRTKEEYSLSLRQF